MALGLGTGIHLNDMVYPPQWDPFGDNNIDLWWDFSNPSGLYKDRDSFDNQVTANNDPIGRVKNVRGKLSPEGTGSPSITTAIGLFAAATSDGGRPVYKTGGANGYSYAQFTSGNSSFLKTQQSTSDSNDFGSHSDGGSTEGVATAGCLTNAVYSSNNWGAFLIVSQADDPGSSGGTENIFNIKFNKFTQNVPASFWGYRYDSSGNTSASQNNKFILKTDNYGLFSQKVTSPLYGGGWTGDLEVRVIFSEPSPQASGLYSGVAMQRGDVYENIWSGTTYVSLATRPEADATAHIWDFLTNAGDDDAGISIGNDLVQTAGDFFDGKIYEVIKLRLNPTLGQVAQMVNYYKNKYGITAGF
tara:strand:- start:1032 stop:2105 length:1074 start_codon:yes stop_codon:yes gene_type:complete